MDTLRPPSSPAAVPTITTSPPSPDNVSLPAVVTTSSLTTDTSHPEAHHYPITHVVMIEPFILVGDSYTYEREEIEEWLKGHDTSPMTGELKAGDRKVIPNRVPKDSTEHWLGFVG